MKRLAALLSLLIAAAPSRAAAADPYEDLAARLGAAAAKKLTDKKIAVLSFDYVDGRASSGGRAVSEKLTNRFVELGELTVIERGMVEKVMKELEFQNTGTVDPESARRLGKGLGVEAIVTGTIEDVAFGNSEINARVIKTESYEIIAAATQRVKKTWSDQPARQSAIPAGAVPESAAPAAAAPSGGHRRVRGFLDVLFGVSNADMDFRMETSVASGEATGLTTNASGVFGLRVGGFGELFGGSVGFSGFNHGNLRQRATINGVTFPGLTMPENFLRVNTFEISGDLLMRLPTGDKVIPYFGLGMGLSINNVTSESTTPFLLMGGGGRLNETVPGFLMRVPFGLRLNPADPLTLFVEGRMWMNTFVFDQNLVGVNDTVTQRGVQFLGGIGLSF